MRKTALYTDGGDHRIFALEIGLESRRLEDIALDDFQVGMFQRKPRRITQDRGNMETRCQCRFHGLPADATTRADDQYVAAHSLKLKDTQKKDHQEKQELDHMKDAHGPA